MLFISVGLTLLTIFYYMRVIAYLYLSSDSNLGSAFWFEVAQINKDLSFLASVTQTQIVLSFFTVFWLVFQGSLLDIVILVNQAVSSAS